jgi:hypothetical protein
MGDSDDSYDFSDLLPFLESLRKGHDVVIGNRFEGGIDPGAMPMLHRYLGTPVLAFIARLFFGVKCRDTQCGLRGFKREVIQNLGLKTTGMEYASEMLVRAAIAKLKIASVPIRLAKDGRSRAPHLHTWSDGWRHLRFMLLYSPRWLFFYPGVAMIIVGFLITLLLLPGPIIIAPGVSLDIHTLLISCVTILIGTQSITFGMLARRYAAVRGFLPAPLAYGKVLKGITLERLLMLGGLIALSGFAGVIWAFLIWKSVSFGALNYLYVLRITMVSATMIAAGLQIAMSGLLVSVMEIEGK